VFVCEEHKKFLSDFHQTL